LSDRFVSLVAAARSLFMARGFARVGMRAICDRAGCSPIQAYRLGLSKEDLLAEISIQLSAEQLAGITASMVARSDESVFEFVERYLLLLYDSDIRNMGIRRESAAHGWMWSSKYEDRIRQQVMALLAPIASLLAERGYDAIDARCYTIWALYYVGYRDAVVANQDAAACFAGIAGSVALALRK